MKCRGFRREQCATSALKACRINENTHATPPFSGAPKQQASLFIEASFTAGFPAASANPSQRNEPLPRYCRGRAFNVSECFAATNDTYAMYERMSRDLSNFSIYATRSSGKSRRLPMGRRDLKEAARTTPAKPRQTRRPLDLTHAARRGLQAAPTSAGAFAASQGSRSRRFSPWPTSIGKAIPSSVHAICWRSKLARRAGSGPSR